MTASLSGISPSRRAEAILALENGDHLDQLTFHARYEAMPKSFRAELIGGRVYVASPLKADHGNIHGLLMMWLNIYRGHTPGTQVLDNATDILGEDSEPQPDGCLYVEGGATHINENGYLVGPPELAAEVASSSASYDLHEKRTDYENYGVSEYLVLIIKGERALWLVRTPGNPKSAFIELPAGADGILRSGRFPGLWLDSPALFRGDVKRVIEVLNLGLASPEHAAFLARARK